MWKSTLCVCLMAQIGYAPAAKSQTLAQSSLAPSSLGSIEVRLESGKAKSVQATYRPARAPKALIILFHQAGSDRREYDEIVPRLFDANYSTLNVNQGGDGLGQRMIDAKPDMEAALAWSQDKNLPVIIWGSSYSASIVYLLAAEQPSKIRAALAFSGGEYLGASRVSDAAKAITIPLFATSSPREVAQMKAIFDLVPSPKKIFFNPVLGGVHGSATLTQRRNPRGAASHWEAVLSFLEAALTNPSAS